MCPHLATSRHKWITDSNGVGCRVSAAKSVSSKQTVFRVSRPPVSTAHTSLRVSVVSSLAALKNRKKVTIGTFAGTPVCVCARKACSTMA
jgi:hypothetical protein